jgi:hypothetical protein
MKASTFKYSRSEAEASLQRATGKQKHEPRRDETVEGDGKREDSGVGLIRMPFEPNPDQISLLPKVLLQPLNLPLFFVPLSSGRLSHRLRLTRALRLLSSHSSYIMLQLIYINHIQANITSQRFTGLLKYR